MEGLDTRLSRSGLRPSSGAWHVSKYPLMQLRPPFVVSSHCVPPHIRGSALLAIFLLLEFSVVLSAFPRAGPPAGSQGPQSCSSFSVSASAWLTVTHASELGSVCYSLWGASWHLAPHGAFPNAYLDIVCGIVLLLTSYPPPPKFIV